MNMDLNVLIIDDSEEDAILIMRELTRVYSAIYERVKNASEFAAALQKRKWNLIICDYVMPGFSAFAALEIMNKEGVDLPFIVVSGKVGEEIAVEVMKAGASDYILKDKLGRLVPVIKRELKQYDLRLKNTSTLYELQESDERYKDICENINDMLFAIDKEERIIYANPSFEKITGYSKDELLNMRMRDIVHPDSMGYWNTTIEKIIEKEKHEKIEMILQAKNNEGIYVEGDCGVKSSKNGRIYVRGMLHDITKRKKTEEMWWKYAAMTNTSSEFMSMVNKEYVYEAVNNSYCIAQGMKREDIIGKTVAEIWGKKVFGEVIRPNIDKCFLGQRIKYKEWIEFAALGKRYHEVSIYPYIQKGEVVNAVITTHDITELDKTESKRKQYVDNLTFLSKAAMGFVELGPQNDVYRYIASCLKELIPDSVVITSVYNKEIPAMKITCILGLGDSTQKVINVIGNYFANKAYKLDEKAIKSFCGGRLLKMKGGVHELSYGNIPEISGRMLEKVFNIKDIYAMGFVSMGELFGSAQIVLTHELSPDKRAIVETFITQASVALLRRKAEENLKNSEERLRILFDYAPESYALCGVENQIVDCNRAFKKLTGFKKEEVIGRNVMEAVSAERIMTARLGKEAIPANEFIAEEYTIKKKDGKEVLTEIAKIPVKVEEKPHFLFIIIDITERKKFVEEIRKLAKFVYENPEPMLRISYGGKLIYANPSSMKIMNELKFEVDKMVPKEWREIVSEVTNVNKKKSVELTVGSNVFSFEVVPLPESGYVNLYGRDITERERSEKALRVSEEKYRTLFEESKDVVCISTPEGKIIDVNRAGIELFAYKTKEELMEMNLSKNIYSDPAEREKMLTQLEVNKYVKDYETNMTTKNNKKLTVLITATPMIDAKGKIIEIRSIMKDITERRHMEAQLVQLQKMESLGMLAGGVAHDFNNLLTGIIANVSYLKTRLGDQKDYIEDILGIEESAKSAAGLTGQLLAFARGGKYTLATLNLNEIINGTIKIISRTFDKKIVIDYSLREDIPLIEAESVQIGQVVMNLCVNARDAMPKGGKLSIKTDIVSLSESDIKEFIEAKPGNYVCLSIADNGTGMDEATCRRIFEPFFSTKGVVSGTGLGLSVVYGIINNHGGFIRVYSEVGKGTEFRVYIPASKKSKTEVIEKNRELVKGKGEVVLIVDDEREIRMLVKRILENSGYKVLMAGNGSEAMKIFKENSKDISLVVLDMIMPDTDSEEVFAKMKSIKKDITALLSTGYSESEKTRKMMENGVKGLIPKPYNVEVLLSYIRNAIDSKPLN